MDKKENNIETQELNNEQLQQLTPEQKKTIWEWVKYLGKTLLVAIIQKLSSNQIKKEGN